MELNVPQVQVNNTGTEIGMGSGVGGGVKGRRRKKGQDQYRVGVVDIFPYRFRTESQKLFVLYPIFITNFSYVEDLL